jgi:pimeloyl-ACP methyl ester carboxylesterase
MRVNGVDLCVETHGSPDDPAILLIPGTTGSMLAWNDDFFRSLAAGPCYVIRYDHRDTGRSASYPSGRRGSRWNQPPAFPDAAGGLVSTIDVYLAFGRMMLNMGRAGDERILSRPTFEG